eukprot:m.38813 g.38813  ORF g.38813 m.38813 type:complete len:304 (-) comp9475_c0_seq1:195-1106(-)
MAKFSTTAFVALCLAAGGSAFGGTSIDYTSWTSALNANVRRGSHLSSVLNIVDYIGMAQSKDFHNFIAALGEVKMGTLSHNESYALGINAYNAFAIKTLIDYACKHDPASGDCIGPVYGLPDIQVGSTGSFDLKYHNLGGQNYSLNDIEGMLRPKPSAPLFNAPLPSEDLRIHACLVCDGMSCPDLATSAYLPETIDEQMTAAAQGWMANPWKGLHINKANMTVSFSKIFYWFSDEFDKQGGPVKAYENFFTKDAKNFFQGNPASSYKLDYFGYIWDANGPIPCDCMPSSTSPDVAVAGCHIR